VREEALGRFEGIVTSRNSLESTVKQKREIKRFAKGERRRLR